MEEVYHEESSLEIIDEEEDYDAEDFEDEGEEEDEGDMTISDFSNDQEFKEFQLSQKNIINFYEEKLGMERSLGEFKPKINVSAPFPNLSQSQKSIPMVKLEDNSLPQRS